MSAIARLCYQVVRPPLANRQKFMLVKNIWNDSRKYGVVEPIKFRTEVIEFDVSRLFRHCYHGLCRRWVSLHPGRHPSRPLSERAPVRRRDDGRARNRIRTSIFRRRSRVASESKVRLNGRVTTTRATIGRADTDPLIRIIFLNSGADPAQRGSKIFLLLKKLPNSQFGTPRALSIRRVHIMGPQICKG